MKVLNVGGGPSRQLPPLYEGWDQHLLDIDPNVNPDVCCDAKQMTKHVKPATYDAVFCSHNLEHFYKHEVPTVLNGFLHVLKPRGFVQIAVPNMMAVFEALVHGAKDIDDTWYKAGENPISFHDVIYGWGKQVAQGNVYYSHKTGFTEQSLAKALSKARFVKVLTAADEAGNLHAYAFKNRPDKALLKLVGV